MHVLSPRAHAMPHRGKRYRKAKTAYGVVTWRSERERARERERVCERERECMRERKRECVREIERDNDEKERGGGGGEREGRRGGYISGKGDV